MADKIRVLVVDDSALMRKRIGDIINSDGECEIIATARNGDEAIKSVAILRPDIITLDIQMSVMDGVVALKYIMSEWPTPVVIITGFSEYNGEKTIKCLEYGAVDLVMKPSGVISLDIDTIRDEILTKVKAAARVNPRLLRPVLMGGAVSKNRREPVFTNKIVVIASSTGGPRALADILPKLDPGIRAGIIVIQHMPEGFTCSMAERLNWESKIVVKEAEDGESIIQGEALIAPGGMHLTVIREQESTEAVKLSKGPKEHGVCPSADVTMKSIAPLYGENCLGVILTGMGNDGVDGLRAIKQAGGYIISEDEATSIVYGMPKAAYDAGIVDKVLPLPEIADEIMRWAKN